MIVDYLDRIEAYGQLPQRLSIALEALRGEDLASRKPGRYDLRGDEIFALVQDYSTKEHAQGRWEAHRRYIDIQYVAQGVEIMGYAPLSGMTVAEPYNSDTDLAFFTGQGSLVTVRAGMFTAFFPHDVHMPGLLVERPAPVRKVVIKVLADSTPR